jgi:general secretion pathway protein L
MLGKSLGLDVGSHSIKIVELRQNLRTVEVARLQAVAVANGASEMDVLRDNAQALGLSGERVVTAIPGDRAARRAIHFPFRERRRIAAAVPFEIENETPFDLDDVFVDWELVGEERVGADVLASVVHRTEVASRLAALRDAGLGARVLEVEGLALANLATFVEMPGTRLLIDLGHRKTTLCLLVDGVARAARTLPLGGRLLTEAIARERNLEWEDAESAKCRDGVFAADGTPSSPATERALARLVRELTRTVGGFESALGAPPDKAIDEITLLGGGARLQRIDEYLGEQLGIRCARFSVPPGETTGAFLAAGDPLRFAPALALALRGTFRARTRMNFLQAEFAPRLDLRRILGQFRGSLVLAGIAAALLLATGIARIAVQNQRAAGLEAQLAQIWEQVQPGQPVPSNVSRALEAALRESQQRADFLGIYGGNLSALDILTEISKLVPKDLDVIFEEMSIDGQVVRFRGHTKSFAAVDQLKTALAAFPHFGEIRVAEIQADSARGGNNFSVTIGLTQGSSAEDAVAPPPAATAAAKPAPVVPAAPVPAAPPAPPAAVAPQAPPPQPKPAEPEL